MRTIAYFMSYLIVQEKSSKASQFLAGMFVITDKLIRTNKSNSWQTPSQAKIDQIFLILVDK